MSKKIAIIISPNWGNYAERFLYQCLNSLKNVKVTANCYIKIWLLDNQTTIESYNFLKQTINQVKLPFDYQIIGFPDNAGFAKSNNQAMMDALNNNFDFIFLLNMDTMLDADCLEHLVKAFENRPDIGAVQARLMMSNQQNIVNSLGNINHYLGFGYCLANGLSLDQAIKKGLLGQVKISYPSGAAVVYRADVLKQVGLFDESYWMYNEDQDLGWRIWLSGYQCFLVPEAIVYHHYEFYRSTKKFYFTDRNRLITIFKNYHFLSLVIIFPALVLMEIFLWPMSLISGWFRQRLKTFFYFINLKNWLAIISARKKIQRNRQVPDRLLVKMFSGKVLFQESENLIIKLGNIFFNTYWQLVKRLIIW